MNEARSIGRDSLADTLTLTAGCGGRGGAQPLAVTMNGGAVLIDAGVMVALASDCNPGSSFTSSMPLMIALAVREMRMTVDEAVWSATAGGARALRRDDVGAIAPGLRADLVLLDAPSRTHLAYRPGVPLVDAVWSGGVRIV